MQNSNERNLCVELLHGRRESARRQYTEARSSHASGATSDDDFIQCAMYVSLRLSKHEAALLEELDEIDARQRCPEGSYTITVDRTLREEVGVL